MRNGNCSERVSDEGAPINSAQILHPAWRAFIRYCAELRYGEIERLSIQDGLPVLAEVTTKKVKFAGSG